MKRILLFLFLLLGLAARAGEPYFSTVGNRTLYYERYKAGTKTLAQTTTLEIWDIVPNGTGRKVNYGMTLQKASGRTMYGGRSNQVTNIDANGDIRMDLGKAVESVLRNYFPKAKITSSGGYALLPADLKPGDTLPDAHCSLSVAGVKLTVDVTERTVLRRETITVPGGTYECIVAREHKVEDAPMHHSDIWSDTWYAPGVGYVRRDDYDKKMNLETSEVLIAITPMQQ